MAEQVKKSWYKKWWVWVIAILVLAGIGTAISQGNKSLSHDYSTAHVCLCRKLYLGQPQCLSFFPHPVPFHSWFCTPFVVYC